MLGGVRWDPKLVSVQYWMFGKYLMMYFFSWIGIEIGIGASLIYN